MTRPVLAGDCVIAACALIAAPRQDWDAILSTLVQAVQTKPQDSLMSIANRLPRDAERFWDDPVFNDALVAVLQAVRTS